MRVRGRWGSRASYALYVEIGTSVAGPTAGEREAAAAGDMSAVEPPVGPLMAPRPTLRPAADDPNGYPSLAARIRAAFAGEEMP